MKRLVANLKVFSSIPEFLHETLVILQSFSESRALAELVRKDRFFQSLSNRQIVFSFESLELNSLHKLVPLLYRISTRNLIAKTQHISSFDWHGFLAFFGNSFADLTDPTSAFILCRQLKGVFSDLAIHNIALELVRWLINHHTDALLNAVRAYVRDAIIIGAIVQLWTVVASRKKSDFPCCSALGIELFRASVDLLKAVSECELEDRPWFPVKILRPSCEGRYANFGIMQLYDDKSLEFMHSLFFSLLESWARGESGKRLIWTVQMLTALASISPAIVISDQRHFSAAAQFLLDALLADRADAWVAGREPVAALIKAAVGLDVPARDFLQHFVAVIDVLINRPMDRSFRHPASEIMFLMRNYGQEDVSKVMVVVIRAFEEKCRDGVRKVAWPAFGEPLNGDVVTSQFQNAVDIFRTGTQRYRIQLASIELFAPIFRLREG